MTERGRVEVDLEELAALVELLKDAEFSEFRYEKADLRIVIRRGDGAGEPEPVVPSANADSSPVSPASRTRAGAPSRPDDAATGERSGAQPIEVEGAALVKAPLLGTFYRRPKPGEMPFVSVGDVVEADSVVCIVEVMKLMNSVTAGTRGVVAAIHASDGELVEFGQPLFSLLPVVD